MVLTRSIAAAALALLVTTGAAASETRLLMVEQAGCAYCAQWNAEIAPAYPKTTEGRFAPLLRADLREGPPDGISYDRKVLFTPTFILLEDGDELARIEGYPGEDFFWPLLSQMLREHTQYDPSAALDAPAEHAEGG